MSSNAPPSNVRSPSDRHPYLVAFLSNLSKIVAVLLILIALLMLTGHVPDISRDAKVLGLAYLVFLWPGSYVGEWIQDNRDDLQSVLFVDVDAREVGGAVAVIPLADFAELEVTDGELEQWAPLLYAGSNLDLEEMTCEGTWRGTLSDRELIASLQAVYECRDQLQDDAQRAFAYETSFWTIVRSATKRCAVQIVESFERQTLPDRGEGIETAIDDALEQFDLKGRYDSPDDLADVDLDELDDHLDGDGDEVDQDSRAEEQTDDQPETPELPADD